MAKDKKIRYLGRMLKRLAAVKVLLVLCLAGWTSLAPAQVSVVSIPLQARQLIGMKVENSDGQKVGTVRNLVVDVKSGQLSYVVIGSGGFFGVQAKLKLAPCQIMSAATTKRQTLAVNANATQWNQAPVFKLSNLASLEEPGRAREISQHFETPTAGLKIAATNSLSTTGREISTNVPEPELKFASDLIGLRVVNQKQEKIGEVSDLLVSFGQPKPTFAVISGGRFFHKERQYAVPLNALNASEKDSKLTLNTDAARLQQAPRFDQHVWVARVTNDSSRVYLYSTLEE